MGAASSQQLPRMLGRYALYDKIASGGMASVHIGRLLGPVGFARTVAIKRMHPQYAEDPEFVSMFLDEAMVAARIRHPNVVPTLDVVSMSGELFLVMDYVHGESFSKLIRLAAQHNTQLPPALVASVMVGVLHGLHAAHEAKSDRGEALEIVHRDVSPHNVLVGIDGNARVLDFGVAKALGRVQTTREGQLKGKLAYMSPEQARGHVTRTTDVYAASVVMWEALTSRRLFVGDNEAQVLTAVLTGCKTPPSRFAPGLPPVVDQMVLRGLSLNSDDRFPTARDMARAIEDSMQLMPASQIGEYVEAAARETLDERSMRIAAIESDSAVRSQPQLDGMLDRETNPPPSMPRSPFDSNSSVRSQPFGQRSPSGVSHPSAMLGPTTMSQEDFIAHHTGVGAHRTGVGAIRTGVSALPPGAMVPGTGVGASLSAASMSLPNLPPGSYVVVQQAPPSGVGWKVAAAIGGGFAALGLVAALVLHASAPQPAVGTLPPAAPSATTADPAPDPAATASAAAAAASASASASAQAAASGAAPVPTWRWMPSAPQQPHHPQPGGSPGWQPPPSQPQSAPQSAPAPQPPAPAKASCDPPWTIDSRGVRVFKKECL